MKTLKLSALSICVAGTLFVGCGGPQAQSWNATSQLQSNTKLRSKAMKRTAGGSFTASYAGMYAERCNLTACVIDYLGRGKGAFIGRSRLRGTGYCGRGGGSFTFKFRSKQHRADALNVSIPICTYGSGYSVPYTVYGGTGKFANASGGGTVSFSLLYPTNIFISSWTGTLYY